MKRGKYMVRNVDSIARKVKRWLYANNYTEKEIKFIVSQPNIKWVEAKTDYELVGFLEQPLDLNPYHHFMLPIDDLDSWKGILEGSK